MFESHVFVQLIILLGSVTLVSTLCHYLKLPTIVGFIIAGVAIGPSGFGLVASLPNADSVAELAILFLMFTIGLEFSFKKLFDMKREFLKLGLTQVVLTIMVVTMVAAGALGIPLNQALFLGFLISLSSTALVMKLLTDARDVATPYGKNALSILLFQDLAVIGMMLALPLMAGTGGELPAFDAVKLARALAELAAVLFALWGASRYVIPFILEEVVKTRSREVFFFSVLFFCLGVAYLFHLGGLSLSLGAFAAGLMIAEGPYGRQVTSDIVPLRDNFLGLFFASIGMLLDLHFVAHHAAVIIAITLSLFLIKTFVVTVVALFNRLPLSISLIMGLMLAQVGEFSFILAARGLDLGLLSEQGHQYFLSVSVLTMACTPFLFKLAPRLALTRPASRWASIGASSAAQPVRAKMKDVKIGAHTLVIGYGISGQNLTAAMDSLKIPYKVVELNYEVVKRLKRQGVDIHFGDATRPEVLEHCGLDTARLVVIAVSGAKLLAPILAAVRHVRPDVQVIVRSQYVRDAETILREPLTDIVVAEIETAVELLARALRVYGVTSEDIRQYMEQARSQLNSYARLSGTLKSPGLTLPSWEALSSIRPLRIGETFRATGKSLADLDIRRRTGTSVVSVYRDGLGTTIPGGSFVLQPADVVHLIGSPEGLAAAEGVLKNG